MAIVVTEAAAGHQEMKIYMYAGKMAGCDLEKLTVDTLFDAVIEVGAF